MCQGIMMDPVRERGGVWSDAFPLHIGVSCGISSSPFAESGLKGPQTLRITDTGNTVTILEKG